MASCGCRLGQHGCPCRIGWFYVKQWPNYSTLCRPHPFYALCTVFYCIFAAVRMQLLTSYQADLCGWLSPISVKFRDPRLNHSGEIRPKGTKYRLFGRLSNFDKCRSEARLMTSYPVCLWTLSSPRMSVQNWDSVLNGGQIIQLIGWPKPFYALLCSI